MCKLINQDLRDDMAEVCEDILLFDNPSFDNSIIGITTDNQAVYDLEGMIYELMQDDDITYEDAIEFIDFNTIRSLPYAGEYAPIVMSFKISEGQVMY